MTIEMIETNKFNQGTKIKVIGVGGCGCNAIERLIDSGVQGVELIAANTDAQALIRNRAHRTIQLGETGLGAGSKPEKGREAAQQAEKEIRDAIKDANMLFITAGMGGGTGTGAAPVIARIARELNILTVGVVTKPLAVEGRRRMSNAEAGVAELEANVDSLIVVLNEKLQETLGADVTLEGALAAADNILNTAVGGIAEIINQYGFINVDFEDVRTVMSVQGKAMMGSARAGGPDRAVIAAEQAVASPLLEGIDLTDAQGVLVLVTGASTDDLKLAEVNKAVGKITEFADPNAQVIFGAAIDPTLGEEIRVTVVATGLSRAQARPQAMSVVQGGLRTGTDNAPIAPQHAGMGAVSPAITPNGGNMGASLPSAGVYASGMPPAAAAHVPAQPFAGAAASMPAAAPAAPNPAVWRSNRTQASARVDALSSGGMSDIEIPAFLRRQAD